MPVLSSVSASPDRLGARKEPGRWSRLWVGGAVTALLVPVGVFGSPAAALAEPTQPGPPCNFILRFQYTTSSSNGLFCPGSNLPYPTQPPIPPTPLPTLPPTLPPTPEPTVPPTPSPSSWPTVSPTDLPTVPPTPTVSPIPLPTKTVIGQPSLDCRGGEAGYQPVLNNTVEGVHVLVDTARPSTTVVDVCVRAENNGNGLGGKVTISGAAPSVTGNPPGVPSNDGNAGLCATTTPNSAPGKHPTATQAVLGVPVIFDTYSDGSSTAWVCVQVGSTPGVNSRVMVPISAGSFGVDPGTTVTFHPDSN